MPNITMPPSAPPNPNDRIINPEGMPQQVYQPNKRSGWKIILTIILVLALAGGGWYYYQASKKTQTAPESNNVSIDFTGPSNIVSNTEGEFHIKYHNGEDADLVDVHMDIIYPTNFQFKSSSPASSTSQGQSFDLPLLRSGKDAELIIRGKLSGATNEQKVITAKLSYQLSNFNSTFGVNKSFTTTIAAPNLTFDLTGPTQVPIGQDSTFTVNYQNVSGQGFDNLAIQLTYPSGFRFTKASLPASNGNNFWNIGSLLQNGNGHIDITGSFMGQNSDQQIVSGAIGQDINGNFASQVTSTATFTLQNGPITITQKAQPSDSINLGGNINVTIDYENSGDLGLTNLVITDTITSNLVDLTRLSVSNATISGSTITWKAATDPDLSLLTPGKSGELNFSIPIKQALPTTLKNQTVKNSVMVASAEVAVPVRADDITIQVGSSISFGVKGDYISGAMPMKVGKQTTFAITFTLGSSSNDLNSTEVVASMPLPASAWKNVIVPDSEKTLFSFDPTSGLIRWELGTVPAYTGTQKPIDEVTFQLVVTPSQSDEGQSIRLLNNIQASAYDSFTNQKLTSNNIYQFSTSDIQTQSFINAGSYVQ